MRRLIAMTAAAVLLLAVVPVASAVTPLTPGTNVTGSIVVGEPGSRTWFARFEVRTTSSGAVQFGYLELFGIGGGPAGEIHEFTVDGVDFAKTASGAKAATLHMQECRIVPSEPCFSSPYELTDGSAVGEVDTFMGSLGWVIQAGDITISPAPANNPLNRVGRATVPANRSYVDVDLRSQGGLGLAPRCFADLQTYRSGAWVTAVRPNYPVTGKMRIYLNKPVLKSTTVAWSVTN
jgi:hypothetical protein